MWEARRHLAVSFREYRRMRELAPSLELGEFLAAVRNEKRVLIAMEKTQYPASEGVFSVASKSSERSREVLHTSR